MVGLLMLCSPFRVIGCEPGPRSVAADAGAFHSTNSPIFTLRALAIRSKTSRDGE